MRRAVMFSTGIEGVLAASFGAEVAQFAVDDGLRILPAAICQ